MLFLLCCLLPVSRLFSQGCSDAGICTLSAFQPGSANADDRPNQLRIGTGFGLADYNIAVLSSMLEYHRQWGARFRTDLRLSHLSHFEEFHGSIHGLGDVFLTGNFQASDRLSTSIGLKIPLTDGDRRDRDGNPMPMDLQSSLGTLDLIAGIGCRIWNLDLFLAWQQPFTQNTNAYIHPCDQVPIDPCPIEFDHEYPTTNGFRRAGDLMFRATRPWHAGGRWTVTPGLLGIYHLADDSFADMDGVRRPIMGSRGLTLNLNVFLDYSLHGRGNIQFQLGAPAIVREARPDGLTRALVAGLQYRHSF
jgi:hypothetical protein